MHRIHAGPRDEIRRSPLECYSIANQRLGGFAISPDLLYSSNDSIRNNRRGDIIEFPFVNDIANRAYGFRSAVFLGRTVALQTITKLR
jgi:hypothetical protein